MDRTISTGGIEKPLIPEGDHLAICWSILDLGTHRKVNTWNPDGVDERRCRLSFEFPEHRAVYNPEKGDQVMSYHERFTPLKFHPKSNLCTKILGPWRNITIKEGDNINLEHYLGQAVMISISHRVTDKGIYENATYSALPEKFKKVYIEEGLLKEKEGGGFVTENEQRIFELDDFSLEKWEQLDDWIKEIISECQEWPELEKQGATFEKSDDDTPAPASKSNPRKGNF